VTDEVFDAPQDENESMSETGRRVAFRQRRGVAGPPVRVFTWKQVLGLCALITAIASAGGKWVVDSYIDQRIAAHNADVEAHAKKFQLVVQSSEARDERAAINVRLDALNEKLDSARLDLNQRLARIEGALGVKAK